MKRIIFLILLFFSFSASASASLIESWSLDSNLNNSIAGWTTLSSNNTSYWIWKFWNSIFLNWNGDLYHSNIIWVKTFGFWVKINELGQTNCNGSQMLLSQTNWWDSNLWLWINPSGYLWFFYGQTNNVLSSSPLSVGQWYYITIIYNDWVYYIYNNWNLLMSLNTWAWFTTLDFHYWTYWNLWVCWLKGYIDEIKLFNHTLSSSEINDLYTNNTISNSSGSSSSSSSGGFINIDLSWVTDILSDLFSWFTAFFTNIWDFIANLTDFNFTYTWFNFDLQKYKNVFSFDFWERNFIINNENCENIIKPLLIYHRYYQWQSNMVDDRPYNIDNSILAFYYELKTNNNPIWEYPGYAKNIKIVNNNNNYYYKLYKNEFNYLTITNKNLFSVDTNVFDDFNIIPFSISIFGFDVVNLINTPLKYFFKLVLLIIELPISLINIISNMYFYLFPPFIAGESYCYAGQLITIPTGFNSGNRINGNNNYGSILYILILSFVAFIKGKKVIKNL